MTPPFSSRYAEFMKAFEAAQCKPLMDQIIAGIRALDTFDQAHAREPDVYETRFNRDCLWTEQSKSAALAAAAQGRAVRYLYKRLPLAAPLDELRPVMADYAVDTAEELIASLLSHIERLQASEKVSA
jgi:hypothetical protein